MTATDLIALLPLLVIAGTTIAVMLAVAVKRHHGLTAALTLAGLAAAFASLRTAAGVAPHQVTPLVLIDDYALFYIGLVLAVSMVFVLLAYDYLQNCEGDHDELYILMLVATLGCSVLASSTHLVSLFLGLELLSVSLYAMIAYLHTRPRPLEAGLKYLVLAAVSAAFLLFGVALLYAALGTMDLARLSEILSGGTVFDRSLVYPGIALVITGLGFKLAIVPFHLWTPDVYEGAPAPVTAYIATASKGAIVAVLLRYFYRSGAHGIGPVFTIFSVMAFASMFAGNILALLQTNVKRMLAYSSIAHLGYVLVAYQAAGELGPTAVTFYLVAYSVTTLGAFGVISALSTREGEPVALEDYRGLFWRRPLIAAVFTAMLLSLAGIPLTAGFIGKFYLVAAGTSSAMWALVICLIVTSAIGLYYYLRVVVTMYSRAETDHAADGQVHAAPKLALAVLAVLLVWFGVFPGGLFQVIRAAVAGLV